MTVNQGLVPEMDLKGRALTIAVVESDVWNPPLTFKATISVIIVVYWKLKDLNLDD